METLTANIGAGVRRATLNGRPHLVAPLSLIVPGVLPGSQGPLYYPPEEVGKAPAVWNEVDLTLGHPADEQGQPVSAKAPGVVQRVGLGKVRNGRYTANGKLTAEGWFDEALVKDRAPVLYNNLLAGRPTELSTGLYTTNHVAPPGYTDHRGRPYSGMVARDYRPDHVAILETQPGACSLKDGCGVLNSDTDLTTAVKSAAVKLNADKGRMPGYGQTFVKGTEVWYVGGDGDEDSFVKSVEPAFKAAGATKVYHESEGFPPKDAGWILVNPKHTTNESLSSPQENRMGALERLWAATLNALVGKKPTPPPTDNAAPDQPRCNRTGVYQPPGYAGVGAGRTHVAAREGIAHTGFEEVQHTPPPPTTPEETAVDEKLKVVNQLTTNCNCWKGKAEVLNAFTVEDLRELAEQFEIVKNHRAGLVTNATTMGCGPKGKEPDGDEKGLPAGKKAEPEPDGDEAPAPEMPAKKPAPPTAPTGNTRKPMTSEEWLAAAPPEVRERDAFAQQILNQHKLAVVQKLVANVASAEERKELGNELLGRPLPELERLLRLVPARPVGNQQQYVDPGYVQPPALYVGANSPYPHYTGNVSSDPDDVLEIPTLNYAETA